MKVHKNIEAHINNNTLPKLAMKGMLFIMLVFVLSMNSYITVYASNEDAFEEKRVLFISSYSPSFSTFFQQIDGLTDAFEGYPILLDMEFMDSKRFNTVENISNFYDLLVYKLNKVPDYDLVIVSDDNGLNFVMEYKDDLFPEIPIVFFGINNLENARNYSMDPLVTGVLETLYIGDTIELALSLNKTATKVIALVDPTPSGQADLIQFYDEQTRFPNQQFLKIDLSDMSMDLFLTALSEVSDDSVVILLSVYTDVHGYIYEFTTTIKNIVSTSTQPVYHNYEHGIGLGLVGGKVISHYEQAQLAADIVLSVFTGTELANIPVMEDNHYQYIIDLEVFESFGLDESMLPSSTIFINDTSSFFEENREVVIFASLFFIVQSSIIVLLVWSLRVRKRSQLEALQSKDDMKQAYKELKDANEELEYTSYHDYLTGVYNRTYFESEIPKLDMQNNTLLSIILVDVNGLKLINDAFGHLAGDKALIKTANLLKEIFKDAIISRIGGDEFAIIHIDKTEQEISNNIRLLHTASNSIEVQGVSLSLSIGYAINDSGTKTLISLFTEAEDWMYREKLSQGPSSRSDIIETIIATINEKDSYSEIHSKRVSLLSARIAELLGIGDSKVSDVRTAGLLHDIGKIIVPTEILTKSGKLTEKEFEEIKKHSEIGYRILNSVSTMSDIANYVFCHHERMDGTGYPRGLKGEEIPIQSRIISIADAIDAMLSDRLYRNHLTKEHCYQELEKNKGTQFCTKAVDVVLANFDEIYSLANQEL